VVAANAVHKKRRVISTPSDSDEEAIVYMISIQEESEEEYESSEDMPNTTVCMVDKNSAGPSNERRGSNEPPASVRQSGKEPVSYPMKLT
jgi:hypothetical protein